MTPTRATFTVSDHEYDIEVMMCGEPDCDCESIWFTLRRVGESSCDGEMPEYSVEVDTATWTEVQPPERSAEEAGVVAELLREYPESARRLFRQRVVARNTARQRLATYRIPAEDVTRGSLILFGQVVSEKGGYGKGDLSFAFSLPWHGSLLRVVDSYCPNPQCHCEEGHLRFIELADHVNAAGIAVVRRQFQARMSFTGEPILGDHGGFSREEAMTLCEAFAETEGFLEEMRGRYASIRKVAVRSLGTVSAPFGGPGDDLRPIGRNAPCLCGSGRKYKNCCGR